MEENNNNENQVKETIKKEGKKLAKKAIKPFMKYIIIGIAIFFGILLAIGVILLIPFLIINTFKAILGIFSFESSAESGSISASANISESVIYIDEDTGYYKLKVKDLSKQILQKLEDQKVNNEVMGFKPEDIEGNENTDDPEVLEELQDMIDKYIKAEVQTMFPKTGKTGFWQNDDVDGKIIIKRALAETGEIKYLKYKKYSEFCKMVEENNPYVLECFSVNPEDFKLCIARKDSITIYYSNDSEINRSGGGISKEELEYQTYLQNYAVPLNFFTTLHVTSQDKEFMEEFVKMATGGDDPEPIVLTYVESKQEYTTTYNYSGLAQKTIKFTKPNGSNLVEGNVRSTLTEEQVDDIREGTTNVNITNNNVHDYYSEAPEYDKEVTISNSGMLYITKANTWLKSSEKQISEVQTDNNGGGTQENYPIEDLPKQLYNYIDWIMDKSTNSVTKIMNTNLKINEFKETIETSSFTKKYTVVDLKSEIVVDEFIKLIKSYPEVEENISTSPSNIFYLLQQQENTQRLEKIMRYVLYKLNDIDYGVTENDLKFLLEDYMLSVGGISGNTVGEKIWFTLLAKGYSKEAIAGVLGNLSVESGLVANNLQDSYAKDGKYEIPPGYTDETYTAVVDDGTYTKNDFVNDSAGYGLAQWTWWSRKEGLYLFAKSQGVSIGDENMQIEYLLGELGHSEYASGYAKRCIGSNNGFTVEDWTKAATPAEAAEAFCWIYENPLAYSSSRAMRAEEYYNRYKDLEEGGIFQSSGSGSVIGTFTSSITGKTFTIFNQNQIPGWGDRCNRAAQISVCSGYYNRTPSEWITIANGAPDCSMPTYQPIYDTCGLTYATSAYSTQKIKQQIQSGGYVIIYLKGAQAGHSGESKYRKKMGKFNALGCNFRL